MKNTVFVWDPNPFNCYGAEVARALSDGFGVTRFARRGEHIGSSSVKNVRILPAPASGRRDLWTAAQYVLGVVVFCVLALVLRRPVVVTWMNNPIEKKAIRLLQIMGCRTVLVVHNPVRGRDEVESQPDIAKIRQNATGLIVHEPALVDGLQSYRNVHVAAHPAYLAWAEATADVTQGQRSSKVALFLGSARKDKGFDQLPAIANELAGLGYSLTCAIGRLTREEESMLNEISNIDVLSGADGHISNRAVREAIEGASVLIAPYSNVTASGTILMAMSVGLPVAAYHDRGLHHLVSESCLARPGTPKNIVKCVTEASGQSSDEILHKSFLHDEKARKEWATAIGSILKDTSASFSRTEDRRNWRSV